MTTIISTEVRRICAYTSSSLTLEPAALARAKITEARAHAASQWHAAATQSPNRQTTERAERRGNLLFRYFSGGSG